MSGELNPQITQMERQQIDDIPNIPTGPEDAGLIAGFGQLVQRVAQLEAQMQGLLDGQQVASDRTPAAEEAAEKTDPVIVGAWCEAPLPLRLKFVRDLLPAEHPLQPVLKEAVGLEELRGSGGELETWLTGYPSLFADAVDRFEKQPACGPSIVERLAAETLREMRQGFETTVEAMGIEWIQPAAGAVIGEEYE